MEVLQNGLRKKIIQIVKTAAAGDFDQSISLAESYIKQLWEEQKNAQEAATAIRQIFCFSLLLHCFLDVDFMVH